MLIIPSDWIEDNDENNIEEKFSQSMEDELFQRKITDIERNKLKDKFKGIDIKKSVYSIPLKIKLTQSDNNNMNTINNKASNTSNSLLFGQMLQIINIVNSYTSLNEEYMLSVNLSYTYIEIPSVIFHYIYYLKLYMQEIKESLVSKEENYRMDKKKIERVIPARRIYKKEKDEDYYNKIYRMLKVNVPSICVSLNQKVKNTEIHFLNLILSQIEGTLDIHMKEREKDLFLFESK